MVDRGALTPNEYWRLTLDVFKYITSIIKSSACFNWRLTLDVFKYSIWHV